MLLKGGGGQYVHNHLDGETCVSSTTKTWAGSDRIKIDLSEIDFKAWMWKELAWDLFQNGRGWVIWAC